MNIFIKKEDFFKLIFKCRFPTEFAKDFIEVVIIKK